MKKHEVSLRRRFVALCINAFMFSIFIAILEDPNLGPLLSLVIIISVLAALLFFVFYPETPGMRMCNLRVVDNEGNTIGLKKRFIRSSPGFAFALMLVVSATELKVINLLAVILGYIFILYYPFNAVYCLVSKERMSIFDRILKTRIVKEYNLPEMLKPKFFGLKIR